MLPCGYGGWGGKVFEGVSFRLAFFLFFYFSKHYQIHFCFIPRIFITCFFSQIQKPQASLNSIIQIKMLTYLIAVAALALPLTLASRPPPLSSCTLSANDCPLSSTCTPTQTCGGLCFTPAPSIPVIPCTVGDNGPCPVSNVCTPTEFCPSPTTPPNQPPTTPPCGGQCLYTGPATQNNSTLPTKPCVVGGNQCDDQAPGVFCSQTEVCRVSPHFIFSLFLLSIPKIAQFPHFRRECSC